MHCKALQFGHRAVLLHVAVS